MDNLEKFNVTAKEFVQALLSVFPNDSDFQMIKFGINTAMLTKRSLVQNIFNQKVSIPYETYILDKNEEFFLNNDFKDIQADDEIATKLIGKLKEMWSVLDTHNRDMVWKYLKVLILLNKRIVE